MKGRANVTNQIQRVFCWAVPCPERVGANKLTCSYALPGTANSWFLSSPSSRLSRSSFIQRIWFLGHCCCWLTFLKVFFCPFLDISYTENRHINQFYRRRLYGKGIFDQYILWAISYNGTLLEINGKNLESFL